MKRENKQEKENNPERFEMEKRGGYINDVKND